MRNFKLACALVLFTSAGPALAQSAVNGDYRAYDGASAYGHNMSGASHMMRHGDRHHVMGSMRHPTVGNTANQRVNGG